MSDPTEWQAADFRAWLASHAPDVIVGISDDGFNCPLARWRQALGESVVIAVVEGVDCPTWVQIFIYNVDVGGAWRRPVTCSEAVRVLDIFVL